MDQVPLSPLHLDELYITLDAPVRIRSADTARSRDHGPGTMALAQKANPGTWVHPLDIESWATSRDKNAPRPFGGRCRLNGTVSTRKFTTLLDYISSEWSFDVGWQGCVLLRTDAKRSSNRTEQQVRELLQRFVTFLACCFIRLPFQVLEPLGSLANQVSRGSPTVPSSRP